MDFMMKYSCDQNLYHFILFNHLSTEPIDYINFEYAIFKPTI